MNLVEVRAEIFSDAAEAADTYLLENERTAWSVQEDVVGRRAWLVGIFPDEKSARLAWAELAAALPTVAADGPEFRALAEADWRDSYKEHFHAWQFGRLHWVPVWDRPVFQLPPGDAVLWLDPGLAFGTGNHETTRLCCERLVERAQEQLGSVVDAGCGSGILALSAALLGCAKVRGFDLDREAVRVSRDNAAMNRLENVVEFAVAGLADGLARRPSDLVLANIQADVLLANRREMIAGVNPGGMLVLSGILATEQATVLDAFAAAAPGWSADSRVLGEWCDVCLTAPG